MARMMNVAARHLTPGLHIVDLVEPRQGTGSIIVVPKHCTRAKVEMAARKNELVAEQGGAASPSGMV